MSKRRKKPKQARSRKGRASNSGHSEAGLRDLYQRACQLAQQGDHAEARRLYDMVGQTVGDPKFKAFIVNDLGALAVLEGDLDAGIANFQKALTINGHCEPARSNLEMVEADRSTQQPLAPKEPDATPRPVKIAILSFLFNWPSRGGGIVHTVELAQFLARAGYQVRHFYARFLPWEIGRVDGPLLSPSEALEFDQANWNVPEIQRRFRQTVDAFAPDYVLIQDCWNFKPHLAEAMRGYPTFLRFQALECLCPLNNIRLLFEGPGRFAQCPKHQLATPDECSACLFQRGRQSGPLHQAERELAGVGTREYYAILCRALRDAEAVLVLNPVTEALLSPYASQVRVVPWGMDPARFPWPWPEQKPARRYQTIFQVGVVDEAMKGFHVLREACEQLFEHRQDLQLVATGEPAGRLDTLTRFTGWVSQEELPRYYHEADIVVVPTIAQEGLSRTSVEAMAAGKPVVASRIGGVPFTVADGVTGLLCEPGDPDDLARKLETLLDDADLRQRMGLAGRRRFEEEFTWDGVIERHYRPLLVAPKKDSPARTQTAGREVQSR